MSLVISDEQKRKLILSHRPDRVAESMKVTLQYVWNMGPPGAQARWDGSTEGERYEGVLVEVRKMVGLLMPEHEDKAREIFALVPWPVGRHDYWQAKTDFGPIPTFERVFGLECPTCGGTGVAGFISGIRCRDC